MNLLLSQTGGAIASVVALAFVLCYALYGLIRGFARTFISMFGTILSILLAILLCSSVANFLENEFGFVSTVSNGISGIMQNMFGEQTMSLPIELVNEQTLSEAGVSGIFISLIMNVKSHEGLPTGATVGEVLSPTFAFYIVMIISAIALFIVFKLIAMVIALIIKKRQKQKKKSALGSLFGFLLGLLGGIIYFETIVMIIGAIPLGFCQNIYRAVNNGAISGFICRINPYSSILDLISSSNISKFVVGILS